jgi:predicted RNase H-like HicB family nuclease
MSSRRPPVRTAIVRERRAAQMRAKALSRARMNRRISVMRKRRKPNRHHLPVVIEQDEDGVFIVAVPTLRGCRSYGRTIQEAMKNIAEAAALCLEDETPSARRTFVGVRDLEIVA